MLQKSSLSINLSKTIPIDLSCGTIYGRKIDNATMMVGLSSQKPSSNMSFNNHQKESNVLKIFDKLFQSKLHQSAPYFFDSDLMVPEKTKKLKPDPSAAAQGSQGKQKKTMNKIIPAPIQPIQLKLKSSKKKKKVVSSERLQQTKPLKKKKSKQAKIKNLQIQAPAAVSTPIRVIPDYSQQSKVPPKVQQQQELIVKHRVMALSAINDDIRRANAVRFSRGRGNEQMNRRLPWGSNEHRLRNMTSRVVEALVQKRDPNVKAECKERRQALGLGFLNNQSESFIQRAIKSLFFDQLIPQLIESSQQNKKQLQFEEKQNKDNNQEIMKYISQKKKYQAQQCMYNKILELITIKKRQENLLKLSEVTKGQFNKSLGKRKGSEQGINQSPSQSQVKIIKSQQLDQSQAQTKENYSLLYEDYRNFIQGHIEKQVPPKKKLQLKEKFNELSLRYQNAIKKPEEQKKQPQFIMEEEEDHATSRIHSQRPQDEPIVEEDDPSLNELLVMSASKKEEQEDDEVYNNEEMEMIHYHYLNEAATYIQKIWRGYLTRKVLAQYLQMVYDEEMQYQSHDYKWNQQFNQQEQQEQQDQQEQQEQQDQQEQEQYQEQEQQGQDTDQQFNQYLYQDVEDQQEEWQQENQALQSTAKQPFYNPFSNSGINSEGKQLHYSNIKSYDENSHANQSEQQCIPAPIPQRYLNDHCINEVHSSILSHIQQELERNKNEQLEALMKRPQSPNIQEIARQVEEINQRTQQTIMQMVQQLVTTRRSSQRYSDLTVLNNSQRQSVQNQKELIQEQSFNKARKQMNTKDNQDKYCTNSDYRQSLQDINESQSSNQTFEDERRINQTAQSSLSSFSANSGGPSMQKKDLNDLMLMREQAIQLRYNTQVELFNELFRQNKLSPQQLQERRIHLNRWAQRQSEDLNSTRKAIEVSYRKAAAACAKAQRDIEFSQRCIVKESGNDSMLLRSLESNEELQRLQREFNDQLNLVQVKRSQLFGRSASHQIKVVDNFEVNDDSLEKEAIPKVNIDEIPETLSQMESSSLLTEDQAIDQQYGVIREETQESEKQQELFQLVSVISTNILEIVIDEFVSEAMQLIQLSPDFLSLIGAMPPQQLVVQTSSSHAEEYIDNFFTFVMSHYYEQVLNNLNTPYGFSSERRMRLIHGYDDYGNDTSDDTECPTNQKDVAFVLDENLFLQFEQLRIQQGDKIPQSQYAIRELEHIHNKVIFDACNECLNVFRPYFLS